MTCSTATTAGRGSINRHSGERSTITYPAKFPRLPILFAVPALIVFMCALGIINQAASLIWPSHNPAGIPLAVTGIFLLMVSLIQMVLCALIAHADHSR
jgi:hypothetical protein